ncbi:putative ABC transporter ATP-binding protein [Comamonas sp. E6]|nr:putative ABC transporter ATP-binding protein [Comamonas sp. E6]
MSMAKASTSSKAKAGTSRAGGSVVVQSAENAHKADVVALSFEKKMAAARKASVNSPLGFVVPKLTGQEALHFMRSVGGFALSSKNRSSKPKR